MDQNSARLYKAWELPVRLFHWVNFLCVIALSLFGLIMLNKGAIGISGIEARIGLKTLDYRSWSRDHDWAGGAL